MEEDNAVTGSEADSASNVVGTDLEADPIGADSSGDSPGAFSPPTCINDRVRFLSPTPSCYAFSSTSPHRRSVSPERLRLAPCGVS